MTRYGPLTLHAMTARFQIYRYCVKAVEKGPSLGCPPGLDEEFQQIAERLAIQFPRFPETLEKTERRR